LSGGGLGGSAIINAPHDGHLVGAQGGDVPFSDLEELSVLVKKLTMNDQLCSKVGKTIVFWVKKNTNYSANLLYPLQGSALHYPSTLTKSTFVCGCFGC
jgi:hypothetical protein